MPGFIWTNTVAATGARFFTVDNDHTDCVKTDRRPFVGALPDNFNSLWELACQR